MICFINILQFLLSHLFIYFCGVAILTGIIFYSDGYRLSLPVLTVNYLPKKRNTKSKEL